MADEKTTAVERLEELLNEKDAELEELRAKVEADEDRDAYRWTRHRRVPKDDDAPNLPVPRLQIRIVPLDKSWESREAVYELVYRHFLGRAGIGHGGDPDLIAIPLSVTRISGGNGEPPIYDGKIDLPFRDGTHIIADAGHLKLPMFVLCNGVVQPIEPRELSALKLSPEQARTLGVQMTEGSLCVTADHRVLTKTRGWVQVSEVEPNDILVDSRELSVVGKER